MTPSEDCRKRFAALRDAYARAIAAGEPIKAGNIARKMAKVRKAAWQVKCLEDRARTHSLTMAGLEPAIQLRSAGKEVGWPGRARSARCPAMVKL